MFVLISSEQTDPKDIMPLYYTRQSVEQVFDVGKNNAELLPLRVHGEETFRGHLMLSFMASVAVLAVGGMLKGSAFHTEGAFHVMRNLKCKVFDDRILVKEPTKKMNEIVKVLKLKLPLEINRAVVRKNFGN
jgi:transposase